MKFESIKMYEQSISHKASAGTHCALIRPDSALLQLAGQNMERGEVEQMKRLLF